MRAVLARSLELYQGRNGGNLPKRMVIHKTTGFKEGEVEGAFDALAGVPEIECIEVSSASCWRGVWLIKSDQVTPPSRPGQKKPASRPSGYPVPRGTMVVRSGNSSLVWVAGNAPEVPTKGDYYQGKKASQSHYSLSGMQEAAPSNLLRMRRSPSPKWIGIMTLSTIPFR